MSNLNKTAMNVYMKNYAIWLGGALALLFVIGFMNIIPFGLHQIVHYLFIIAGTIIGTVMTHKELGRNIEFGKAVGPVLLFIGGFSILGLIIFIVRWGAGFVEYWLPQYLVELFTQLVIGVSILLATGTWYMFEKAGKPGWGMIVPIYNLILMCEIAKKPTWWVVMFLVPIANIVFLIMMLDGISKNFGKDSGFTVGLIFLRQIFFAILGYGSAQYLGKETIANEEVLDDI